MRLVDFVVSYSLQINNRCLRYLAECDAHHAPVARPQDAPTPPHQPEMHTVYAESLLARDSRRLASMWSLIGVEHIANSSAAVHQHIEDLVQQTEQLADVASARRLALRLASLAQDELDAQAMLFTSRHLPDNGAVTWDALNELFARDSHFWRQVELFRDIDNELLVKRITRSYRKAYRMARELDGLGETADQRRWLAKRHAKMCVWVQASAHQMELLRPGLSDRSKSQLWYMDKLLDTLRMRRGLMGLARSQRQLDKRYKTDGRAMQYIQEQIDKMDKRILRLSSNCFAYKPKKLRKMLEQSLAGLELNRISLLNPQNTPPTSAATLGGVNQDDTVPLQSNV
ncbi:MAG: hypothetical protein AAF993_18765 [Pseudomonadota bacterium]